MPALLALPQAVKESKVSPNDGVQAVTDRRWRIAQVQEDLRPPGMASRPALPADAAADSLHRGARSVAEIIRVSVSDATLARRNNIFGDLERFLSPHGIGVVDASPFA